MVGRGGSGVRRGRADSRERLDGHRASGVLVPGYMVVDEVLPASCVPPPRQGTDVSADYREGDRCCVCGYWYWELDGLWHSLVPITFTDTPELRRLVFCGLHFPNPPTEADVERGEQLAKEHGW